jgi:peptidoglycan/xylan/chitin deacetylase (PgdA/CDA1 family)
MTLAFTPPPRDLTGYGPAGLRFRWPGQALAAVTLVVNFEEGAEFAVGDGDSTSERVTEIASVIPDGQWDPGTEQEFAYGARAGIWRVLDTLARSPFPATFYICGRAAERSPEIADAIVKAGHEPACHGWRWQAHAAYTDMEVERRDLIRCIDAIESATGERPRGFFCRGSESRWTRQLLEELGFVYTSNAFDDDLPYNDRATPLVVVPYSLDSNDTKFLRPNGYLLAEDFVQYVRDSVESLIEEGTRGYPKMLNIGFHLRITGRPGRIRALEQTLKLLESLGDKVWVARRIDIANFWKENFPRSVG